ncbi:MAG: LysM peptidoglycan-binding domain-containing protein [Chloroflexi bacterium]|nr:LysM peptidoglycan-binding domain-containing protein [Chloroflexota bacterium]
MTLARLRLALLLGLLAIAFGSPVAARAQTAGPEYVVQSGDTLYTIAARFGTTVAALQSANTIADPATIYAGQVLVIPGFEGITGRLTPHTVALGDTLASLSLRFGVSPETFARLNHVVNPSTLYLGEEVYYPE